ncbi:MAG: uncharacterized protein KVP18_002623 [Porospora cf. gigantea A]|uniref:uncharacterized protein n=1 Tax=Porospora cf. gigantea A TaxID=2853593 RepID=UPI00355A2F60|nr:MAG: hypothetical protein KVP18_002623 [Porospora cf. gigantea A]
MIRATQRCPDAFSVLAHTVWSGRALSPLEPSTRLEVLTRALEPLPEFYHKRCLQLATLTPQTLLELDLLRWDNSRLKAVIQGEAFDTVLDTGSSGNVMTLGAFNALRPRPDICSVRTTRCQQINGRFLPVAGATVLNVTIGGIKRAVPFLIVDAKPKAPPVVLLGVSFMEAARCVLDYRMSRLSLEGPAGATTVPMLLKGKTAARHLSQYSYLVNRLESHESGASHVAKELVCHVDVDGADASSMPVEMAGLLDTGSGRSMVSPAVLDTLAISPKVFRHCKLSVALTNGDKEPIRSFAELRVRFKGSNFLLRHPFLVVRSVAKRMLVLGADLLGVLQAKLDVGKLSLVVEDPLVPRSTTNVTVLSHGKPHEN